MDDKAYITKDSGTKQEFETGAHRDTQAGKGRYDLIPPIALRRLAGVYERGAAKYQARNWEKGMNIGRFLDSALRHIYQYIEGRRDEDHLAQAMWNIAGAIHVETMIERGLLPKELNDMPNHMEPKRKPDDLSQHKGKMVRFPDGRIGRIVQFAELTPPDTGLMVDVEFDNERMAVYLAGKEELEQSLVDRAPCEGT